MKQEFMLLIRNVGDGKKGLSESDHLSFVKNCESYIKDLKSKNQLLAAQPLIRAGAVLTKERDNWTISDLDLNKETQVGYYHIFADDVQEAIEIAKGNPEFDFVPSASIEVRPIKTTESKTAFVYPTESQAHRTT